MNEERAIAIGKSKQKSEYFWSIVDDFTLTYLAGLNGTPDDPNFFPILEAEIYNRSDKIANACEALALELIDGEYEGRESP